MTAACATAVFCLSACGNDDDSTDRTALKEVSVTILNGDHYSVVGEHKKSIIRGGRVVFDLLVDEGYELVSSFGKQCRITPFKENRSFRQSVVFEEVNYNSSVTFEVKELDVTEFVVSSNVTECEIEIDSAAGQPSDGELYVDDEISVYAIPATGYRFQCWSTGNYLSAGGKYLSNDKMLDGFDFNSTSKLYANFKSTADSARTIIYDFGEGVEIEQDCSPILAHHYRANTLTEPDLREQGFEFPNDKMLTGWLTESGEYVGLGSRTEVSEETYINLFPAWKEYSAESDFSFSDGKITDYTGNENEVVIPNEINGEAVTGIAANAFENCNAAVYYIPNSVTAIEKNSFLNCKSLTKFYMSDNVMEISDESFTGCENFTTLHLNAYLKPRYAKAFGSLKGNIYDKLIIDKNEKKCVILGGSSVSDAYNVPLSEEILKGQYYVYNFGYNMSMCGYAYFDIIDKYLNAGDIFLHAPEQNGASWCSAFENSVLNGKSSVKLLGRYLFEIIECNWQLLSELNVKNYSNLISSFNSFNNSRKGWTQEYNDYFAVIPNGQIGGQTILGEEVQYGCGINGHVFGSNGNLSFNTNEELIKAADSNIYKPLSEKGVKVCLTFAPINRHNLYRTYNNEDTLKTEADKFTLKVNNLVSDNVNVLLTQYDTLYNGEFFANTDYHLGHPKRDEHTTKVMNALIEALGL